MENVSPQLEHGYIKIANELQEAFCRFRIPGEIWQILHSIIRKTYGWNKKYDWVSHSQIVEMTGLLKGNVSRSLSKAIIHKIVIVSDNKVKLNKNYKEWIPFGGNHFNPKKLSNAITKKRVIVSDNKVIVSDSRVIVSEGNKIQYTKDNINTMGNPINLEKLEKQKKELTKKLSSGISTKHQAQAFDYLKRLNIDSKEIKNKSLTGRWISLFKSGSQAKLQATLSYYYDLDSYRKKLPDEKIMLFFWYYNNKA